MEKKGIIIIILILLIAIIATIIGISKTINKKSTNKNVIDFSDTQNSNTITQEAMEDNDSNPLKWIDNKDGTFCQGDTIVKIGDYVNYDSKTNTTYISLKNKNGYKNQIFNSSDYTGKWRVMGVTESGQLELIADISVPLVEAGEENVFYLQGKSGYINGVEELNNICNIYGKGKGAMTARSIVAEDINKILGYNPNNIGVRDINQTGEGKKCEQGKVGEYGSKVTYTLTQQGLEYKSTNGQNGIVDVNTFIYYNKNDKTWKQLTMNQSLTVDNTSYTYDASTLEENNSIEIIKKDSIEYQMLFGKNLLFSKSYWLASEDIGTAKAGIYFGLKSVTAGIILPSILYRSDDWTLGSIFDDLANITGDEIELNGPMDGFVRPVISLLPNIKLEDSKTQYNECTIWNIQ